MKTSTVNSITGLCKITGIVDWVKFPEKGGKITKLNIKFPNSGKNYSAQADFNCPVRKGDKIHGLAEFNGDVFYFKLPLFATLTVDREYVVKAIMNSLKIDHWEATIIYEKWKYHDKSESDVVNTISYLADGYRKTRSPYFSEQVSGLEEDDACKFLRYWYKNHNLRRLLLLGLTTKEINAYRDNSKKWRKTNEICHMYVNNPYTLASISIEKAIKTDETNLICTDRDPTINRDKRYLGEISRAIWNNMCEKSWTCTPKAEIAKTFPDITSLIISLKESYDVHEDMEHLYMGFPLFVEKDLAAYITEMRKCDKITYDTPVNEEITLKNGLKFPRKAAEVVDQVAISKRHKIKYGTPSDKKIPLKNISKFRRKPGEVVGQVAISKRDEITYDTPVNEEITLKNGSKYRRTPAEVDDNTSADQAKAIQGALDHKICIITGGAGTGKSTTLCKICDNLEHRCISYVVCSFTGKAVARIREMRPSMNAYTIHKLIAKAKIFSKTNNEEEIPSYQHVIIDEASMMTTQLWWELKKYYPDVRQWTLVGDVNQILPIKWGSAFSQIIKSQTIPTYYLTTNYRVYRDNGERDGIILNASSLINHVSKDPFEFTTTSNFVVESGYLSTVYEKIYFYYKKGIPAPDIVILCPYKKYLDEINKEFQEIYNPNERRVTDRRKCTWCFGDRVMLTKNDPKIEVYNGETGVIVGVNNLAVTVDFGGKRVHNFTLAPELQNLPDEDDNGDEDDDEDGKLRGTVLRLKLAYALTVNKSQGSEWDYIIYYIPKYNAHNLLNKNLHYTAITRAKKEVCCIAESISGFQKDAAIPAPYRHENLSLRLQQTLPKVLPYATEPNNSSPPNQE